MSSPNFPLPPGHHQPLNQSCTRLVTSSLFLLSGNLRLGVVSLTLLDITARFCGLRFLGCDLGFGVMSLAFLDLNITSVLCCLCFLGCDLGFGVMSFTFLDLNITSVLCCFCFLGCDLSFGVVRFALLNIATRLCGLGFLCCDLSLYVLLVTF